MFTISCRQLHLSGIERVMRTFIKEEKECRQLHLSGIESYKGIHEQIIDYTVNCTSVV